MHIGVTLAGWSDGSLELAVEAERLGFESVWVADRAVLPLQTGGWDRDSFVATDPASQTAEAKPIAQVYSDRPDPMVLLAAIAARTTRIRLGTAMLAAPEWHPLRLAKQVATLDGLSGGRFELGVGAGWIEEQHRLFSGVEWRKRWRYVEESVEAMRLLWRDGEASFGGEYISFPPVSCRPLPPHVPKVTIGARLGTPRSVERIARFGDGWSPTLLEPSVIADVAGQLRTLRAGEDRPDVEISVHVMDISRATQERYAAAGACRLVLLFYNHPGGELPFERWHETRYLGLDQPAPPLGKAMRDLARLAANAGLRPSVP